MTPLVLSFVLTLLIFSYLLADNLLFRLAVSVFVGMAAAFTSVVTVETVLLPLLDGSTINALLLVVGAVLTGLLLLKPFPALKTFSSIGLAVLIAVGAAVAVVGAITGTLIPLTLDTGQVRGTDVRGLLDTAVMVLGVISTLVYFQYFAQRTERNEATGTPETTRRGVFSRVFGTLGEGFIAVTLGALYASAILTSLTILAGHLGTFFSAA